MIKFFRKIRQNLLSENKFSKYLIYAIGEIVLVVIGILIALQINNWNESRKEYKLKESYYKRLLVDLKADKEYANNYISRIDSSITRYENYRKSYEKPNLSLAEILKNLGTNDIYTIDLEYQTSTIETLISSGNLQVLSPKVIDLITKYQEKRNQSETLIRSNNNNVGDLLKDASLNGGILLSPDLYPNQPELLKKMGFEDRIPDLIIAFESYVVWKRGIDETSTKMLKNINKIADSIIENIHLELKK